MALFAALCRKSYRVKYLQNCWKYAQGLYLLHETNFIFKLCEKNNAKLKNSTNMVKLSPTILVRSYTFADIMTRDKYVAFKMILCRRTGNFL